MAVKAERRSTVSTGGEKTGKLTMARAGKLIFNMLVLVGAVKMADRLVREMLVL